MHDPCTLVFDIRWPLRVTIWHVDPERDGSDDSCDWFGGRGCPAKTLGAIRQAFLFEGRDDGGISWFGDARYAPDLMGLGLCMFRVAANCHFGHWSKRANRFLQNNLFDILHFIDNGCDSINSEIRRAAAVSGNERVEILNRLARIVYSWILRRERPWWKHPRWHFWHWRLQVHCLLDLKRWLFSRCEKCGKRFSWGYAPMSSNWDSDGPRWFRGEPGVRHHQCQEKDS